MPEFSIITSFLGQTKDRFHVYNQTKSLEEKFAVVAAMPGYTGVEVVYPYEVSDVAELTGALDRHGLELSAVNVNVKGEPEFVSGGITSDSRAVREKAIRFIKEAKEFALAVGAPRVTCCPLGDGFEFPFQVEYRTMWKRLADAFGEGAAHKPEMPLFIEYKPKETRGRCFLNRAADTLHLLRDIGETNLGITMDYGHSVYGGEHPAETLTMLHYSDYPYYVHINDNDKSWDWDFFCGSHTLLEYIEFIYYLKRYGYESHLTTDSHPTRWDMQEMFTINSRITTKIWNKLDEIGMDAIAGWIEEPNYMKTWKKIEEELFTFT
ncbi:MAG: sugar phosphate isomerase/epimerase family protein [Alkalispirochaetaceae bacterium]